jgi:hypothetical protein
MRVSSHALLQGTFQSLDYNKGLMSVPTMFQLQVLGTLRTGKH